MLTQSVYGWLQPVIKVYSRTAMPVKISVLNLPNLPFVFDAEINQNDGHNNPEQSLDEKEEKPDPSELLEPFSQLFTSKKLEPIRHSHSRRIPFKS